MFSPHRSIVALAGILKPTPPPVTSDEMAPTTFPRFLELPTELQMQVWSYVAYPNDRVPRFERFIRLLLIAYAEGHGIELNYINMDTFPTFLYGTTYNFWSHGQPGRSPMRPQERFAYLPTSTMPPYRYFNDEGTGTARHFMTMVCRLSRQVALETWKRDIEEASNLRKVHFDPWIVDLCKGVRQEVLKLLDGLIAEVKEPHGYVAIQAHVRRRVDHVEPYKKQRPVAWNCPGCGSSRRCSDTEESGCVQERFLRLATLRDLDDLSDKLEKYLAPSVADHFEIPSPY